MEVTFQKNVRILMVDLILIRIGVPDFSLKINLKSRQISYMQSFSMFTFSKIEIFSH